MSYLKLVFGAALVAVFSSGIYADQNEYDYIEEAMPINSAIGSCFIVESYNNNQVEYASCPSVAPVMLNGGCEIQSGGTGDQDLTTNRPQDLDTWKCVTSDPSRKVKAFATCCTSL